ncbi:MAG: sigma-54-dependent Fis family transcriptional regulator [Deltaproteobacteria bacterium]|nr:sigma-54-dependent Fis family transcriptional regulator [Deltaproteobacteria bacterium]
MTKILIVDDDPQLRHSFEKILTADGHTVLTAATAETGLIMVAQGKPDLVIMDVRLPGMNGVEALEAIRKVEPKLPVIIMTAYGATETAIEATKKGAFDYVIKPFDIPDILDVIEKALQAGRFMRSRVEMDATPETAPPDALIGQSPPMREVYKSIGRVAPTDATVLIRGESGTGKELVARAIYQHSLRADKPFLIINCVAIPETLLESELFGYEKGAFTGAANRRVGKIEQAHQGTVFLDEIGDMPFSIQAKLLRLLQERNIERLGGRKPVPVDVRIIAATSRDLERAVADGQFREDLYYRLKVVTIWLPPLRERKEDIPLLADYFLTRFSRDMDTPNPGLSERAKQAVMTYAWPGNVRELANTFQKALIFSRGCPLDIWENFDQDHSPDSPGAKSDGEIDDQQMDRVLQRWLQQKLTLAGDENLFDDLMDHFAATLVREALNYCRGNRTHTAKLLGLSRPTLLSKIEKYGIKIETSAC